MPERELKYPSTTQILKPWVDVQWFTEESRTRGSAVHNTISAKLQGLWHPSLKPEYQGYVDSAFKWIDLMVDKIILIETRLTDEKRGYCGKPDLIAILKGDTESTMVDWKTALQTHITWGPQIASYRSLALEDKKIRTHRGMSIRLKADGKLPLVDEKTNMQADLSVFLSALTTYKYFKGGTNG